MHVLQQLKNDKVKLELAYVLLIYVLLFVQFAQYKRCDKFHMIPGISLLFVTQLEWDLLDELARSCLRVVCGLKQVLISNGNRILFMYSDTFFM